jgi:hypothetical protein
MPRRSAESLAVVRPIEDHRPPAPDSMPEAQAEIWRRTVNRLPHDWFRQEHLEMLRAYCQHVAIGHEIARQIERFDPDWLKRDDGVARLDQLTKLLDREHKLMLALARAMRFTHQSQYDRTVAASGARKVRASGPAPWEGFKGAKD